MNLRKIAFSLAFLSVFTVFLYFPILSCQNFTDVHSCSIISMTHSSIISILHHQNEDFLEQLEVMRMQMRFLMCSYGILLECHLVKISRYLCDMWQFVVNSVRMQSSTSVWGKRVCWRRWDYLEVKGYSEVALCFVKMCLTTYAPTLFSWGGVWWPFVESKQASLGKLL